MKTKDLLILSAIAAAYWYYKKKQGPQRTGSPQEKADVKGQYSQKGNTATATSEGKG